jgi:hypothetical protein
MKIKIRIHLKNKNKLRLKRKFILQQKYQQLDQSQACDRIDKKMKSIAKNAANILLNKAAVIMEQTSWQI